MEGVGGGRQGSKLAIMVQTCLLSMWKEHVLLVLYLNQQNHWARCGFCRQSFCDLFHVPYQYDYVDKTL